MSALPITFLSWNTARLLALVLNSLTGLLQYYEKDQNNLDADALFGLRIIQGFLLKLIRLNGVDMCLFKCLIFVISIIFIATIFDLLKQN